jgi:uncharacterized protein YjbI with pentapeptide repeats
MLSLSILMPRWLKLVVRSWLTKVRPTPILVFAIAAFVSVPVLVWVPEWMVNQYARTGKGLNSDEYAKHVDEYRKTIAQILAGIGGIYGLHLVWRRTKVAEHTQITDLFTKAVEQLGSCGKDGKPQLEIRFGGIYVLERIARDSSRDHWPIMEIFTAYVRQNAPVSYPREIPVEGQKPREDIQAVLTVLGRRRIDYPEFGCLNLTEVDLRGAKLNDAHLEHAILTGAHLEGANLERAHLEGANLARAHLEHANVIDADLEGANLGNAHLEGAYLMGADLEGATLTGAHLEGAYLSRARLKHADLGAAHLEGAILADADLGGADLVCAHLEGAIVTDAHLEGAKGADLSKALGTPLARREEPTTGPRDDSASAV